MLFQAMVKWEQKCDGGSWGENAIAIESATKQTSKYEQIKSLADPTLPFKMKSQRRWINTKSEHARSWTCRLRTVSATMLITPKHINYAQSPSRPAVPRAPDKPKQRAAMVTLCTPTHCIPRDTGHIVSSDIVVNKPFVCVAGKRITLLGEKTTT